MKQTKQVRVLADLGICIWTCVNAYLEFQKYKSMCKVKTYKQDFKIYQLRQFYGKIYINDNSVCYR